MAVQLIFEHCQTCISEKMCCGPLGTQQPLAEITLRIEPSLLALLWAEMAVTPQQLPARCPGAAGSCADSLVHSELVWRRQQGALPAAQCGVQALLSDHGPMSWVLPGWKCLSRWLCQGRKAFCCEYGSAEEIFSEL